MYPSDWLVSMRITSPKREARYGQLLKAALKVFARDGIDGASVADIAEAAGVAKGSVYLYFDSKEALAGDLVRALFTYTDDSEVRLSEDPQPIERLLRFCDEQEARVGALGNDSAIVLHMFGHIGKSKSDLLGCGTRQIIAEARFKVRVLLENARSRGQLPADTDCERAAASILASTYGTIQQQITMKAVNPKGGLKVREAVSLVLRGLGYQR